jgi:site-specific recombinase XerD
VFVLKAWEQFLKVRGWESDYYSVSAYLRYFRRKVGSERTKDQACYTLMAFCRFAGMNPDGLVRLSVGEASRLVQSYVDSLAGRGFSIRTVNVTLAYLKTFFRVNGFKGGRELDVERYHQPTRYRKKPEYVPTPDEIWAMANASGSLRNKSMILALYTSGLRNSTLRALLYKDVKDEIEKGLDVIRVPVYPEMKRVDPAACKGNIPYYTFLSSEATSALREYLEERRAFYGDIGDQEPLFISTSTNVPPERRRLTPVKRRSLTEMVKKAAKKAGIKRWRDVYPHCLRKAFESALRNGGLDVKDQEFLMGHILPGSQDAYYDYTKVEELRAKYARIEFFPRVRSSEELRKKQILDMVRILGFPEDRIKRVEEALAKYATVDEAMEEIRKLSLEGYKIKENTRSDPKKIVSEDELEHYLAEGWDVQTVLPSGKILIKKIS